MFQACNMHRGCICIHSSDHAKSTASVAGVALGCIAIGARRITDAMMLAASKALSSCLTAEELGDESILPRIERLRSVC